MVFFVNKNGTRKRFKNYQTEFFKKNKKNNSFFKKVSSVNRAKISSNKLGATN